MCVGEGGGEGGEFVGVGGELDDVVSALLGVWAWLAAPGWADGQDVLEVAVGGVEQDPDGALGVVPGHRHSDGVGDRAAAGDLPGVAVEAEHGGQPGTERDPWQERHPPRHLLRGIGGSWGVPWIVALRRVAVIAVARWVVDRTALRPVDRCPVVRSFAAAAVPGSVAVGSADVGVVVVGCVVAAAMAGSAAVPGSGVVRSAGSVVIR